MAVAGVQYFVVVYGPYKPNKKHHQWTGDGYLKVAGSNATLIDQESSKIIGSGPLKKEETPVEEGAILLVGRYNCQIEGACDPPEMKEQPPQVENVQPKVSTYNLSAPKYSVSLFKSPMLSSNSKTAKPFVDPFIRKGEFRRIPTTEEEAAKVKEPLFSPSEGLLLARPKGDKNAVDVVVDPRLVSKMREHQKEGVKFMYECIMGFREYGSGAILADEMGLGKTLQCIALIWTILYQGPDRGLPMAKRVIIIVPAGLVKNWSKEFKKWLGDERLKTYIVDKKNTVALFKSYTKSQNNPLSKVLIISYELFGKNMKHLAEIDFDLMICDEGHRLKNNKTKTVTNLIETIDTDRRILLTGTPVQNNLKELYSLVDFVNPNALGTYSKFEREFERPITRLEAAEATEEEKEDGKFKQALLYQILNCFMLRRTQDALNDYLPHKTEYIICCKPLGIQISFYQKLLNESAVRQLLDLGHQSECTFTYINRLRKICNHPKLLTTAEPDELLYSGFDSETFNGIGKMLEEASAKMQVLTKMLRYIKTQTNEKVVVVSHFSKTLNILEEICKKYSYTYARIDGSVNSNKRQEIVDSFNSSSATFIMLLSTKAGGVGLNLIGASRLILFDMDWNPAHDTQAKARIWRDGQKRNVHVYSLLTTGTIEEKIFQRQVMKQGLAGVVGDTTKSTKFSTDELKDLFSLELGTSSSTHDLISDSCDCIPSEEPTLVEMNRIVKKKKRKKSSELDLFNEDEKEEESTNNLKMSDLKDWDHFSHDSLEGVDECIPVDSEIISFIFRNRSKFQQSDRSGDADGTN